MQHVPVKNTSAIDFTEPLKTYIKDNYSKTEFAEVGPAITDVQRMRDMVVRAVSANSIGGETFRAITELNEYLAALRGLQQRFPFGVCEAGSMFKRKKATSVMIHFMWTDCYRVNKCAYNYSLEFEMAAVVFNLGALHSLMAVNQDRSIADGVQTAATNFQTAAGIFEFMSTNMALPTTADSFDLSSSSLKFLSLLMLAQAASCAFEKALIKKMKPAILSVLAQGASHAFERAREVLKVDENLQKWMLKGNHQFMKHCTYSKRCLASAAQYWQSLKDEEDGKYGIVVSRLGHAKSMVESASKYELASDTKVGRQKLTEAITLRLSSSVKDNESIYHYAIPTVEELPEIASKLITKSANYSLPGASLSGSFDKLVPLATHQAAERFKEELSDEIVRVSKTCADAADTAKMALDTLNLPAAVDALEADTALPDAIWAQIVQIQHDGGAVRLNERMIGVQENGKMSWDMLEDIKSLLKKEEEEEQKYRSQFGGRWDRTPSHQITGSYRNDIDTVNNHLLLARNADRKVQSDINENRTSLALLSKSREELNGMIPKLDSSGKSEASEALRSVLRKLSSLLNKRDKIVAQFIEAVEAHNTVAFIQSHSSMSDVEQLLAVERESAFQQYRDQIKANISKQTELLSEINEANRIFVESRRDSMQLDARTQVLQQINTGIQMFNTISSDIEEGSKFYSNLINDFLSPLSDNVGGFVTAREHEARLLLEDVSRQCASNSSSGYPTSASQQQQPQPQQQQPQQGYPSFGSSRPSAPEF